MSQAAVDDSAALHHHEAEPLLLPHAQPEATVWGTVFNLVCNIIGVGVLAIPLALRNASLGFGVVLIAAFGFIAAFAGYVLSVACEYTGKFSQNLLLAHCLCNCRGSDERIAGGKMVLVDNAVLQDGADSGGYLDNDAELRAASVESSRMYSVTAIIVDTVVVANNMGCLIPYARVVADSMVKVCQDLNSPQFFLNHTLPNA